MGNVELQDTSMGQMHTPHPILLVQHPACAPTPPPPRADRNRHSRPDELILGVPDTSDRLV